MIRPLGDRVLVKRYEGDSMTAGGLYIPEVAKEKPVEGDVVAVGSGRRFSDGTKEPLEVKVGDRVLFGKFAGSEVKIGGVDHLLLREEDILGIVDEG